MTKDNIRVFMRKKRREITNDFKIYASNQISNKIIPIISSLSCVMVYMSSFNEPDTSAIVKYLIDNNIKVVVPISNVNDFTITPSYISCLDDLKKGAYGIYEPDVIYKAKLDDIDLILVPGIAFSKSGDRIGFGKGYYDKLLQNFSGKKVGICYDFQVIESVPASKHDIKMDMIVTEERIYNDFWHTCSL